MKIASIQLEVFNIPITVPYRLAYGLISETKQYLITIKLKNGLEGYGVGTADEHITGETDESLLHALQESKIEWIIGNSIEKISEILKKIAIKFYKNPGARCALDIAIHDIYGKYLNKPLVEILGRCHDSLPTSVTVGIGTNDEALNQIESYLLKGFNEIKMKTGDDLDKDIDRIQFIYSEFKNKITIKIDPNMGYSIKQLKTFINKVKGIPIQFIEQPLAPLIMPGCRSLHEDDIQKLMVDESLINLDDAKRILSLPNHFSLMNIKLQKCGGINPALEIANLAHSKHKFLMWGCFDESVVSISAAIHTAYSSPATKYLDLDGSFDLKWDFAKGGFSIKNGNLILNNKPGLGITRLI